MICVFLIVNFSGCKVNPKRDGNRAPVEDSYKHDISYFAVYEDLIFAAN
jgi:hypothetical protein